MFNFQQAFLCEHTNEVSGTISICFSHNLVPGDIPKQPRFMKSTNRFLLLNDVNLIKNYSFFKRRPGELEKKMQSVQ